MIFSVLSSLVIIEPLIIFRKFFTGFFFAEQTVIQNAHLRIMCILFFEPLCSFYEILAGVLRGTGHSLSPAIAAIIGTCCFRIIWIYTIFGEYCQLSVLYYAFPISWILTMVKKKRIVIRIAFCDFALWNSDHRNLGLVFPEFLFFWAEWNA